MIKLHERCNKCNKKSPMSYNCCYCKKIFCNKCRFADLHDCLPLEERLALDREKLSTKLAKEKCIADKVSRI